MKHVLPPLPFAQNALEPVLSAETLEFHHGKHHAAYVKKTNELVAGSEFEDLTLEEIVSHPRATGPLYNNAAQAWNHGFFWNCLAPPPHGKGQGHVRGRAREPEGELRLAMDRDLGSLEGFRKKFGDVASTLFGSGWAWLTYDADSETLKVESTSNAGNPMRVGRTPLMTLDVWEHAYYLDYRNERSRFIEAVWSLWNWEFIERNFEIARTRGALGANEEREPAA